MTKRKGCLAIALLLATWIVPVNADDSADEIVAMISWWEEYGQYWEEVGVDSSLTETDEEAAFAWLSDLFTDSGRRTQ